MKRWWEGLKPPERRWAAFIGIIFFLMLNYFLVWPHVGELKRDAIRIANTQRTNDLYSAELRHTNEYVRKIREFNAAGEDVLPEDQAIDFVRFFNNCAVLNSVIINNQQNLTTKTNDNFLDQQMTVGVTAYETNLVNFLYGLGAGNSTIRVRTMNLHPDPAHQQLGATITLVASYLKKMPAARGSAAKPPASMPPPQPKVPVTPPVVKPPDPVKKTAPVTSMPPTTNLRSGPFSHPISTNKPGS